VVGAPRPSRGAADRLRPPDGATAPSDGPPHERSRLRPRCQCDGARGLQSLRGDALLCRVPQRQRHPDAGLQRSRRLHPRRPQAPRLGEAAALRSELLAQVWAVRGHRRPVLGR
jgi:hypothetical protein